MNKHQFLARTSSQKARVRCNMDRRTSRTGFRLSLGVGGIRMRRRTAGYLLFPSTEKVGEKKEKKKTHEEWAAAWVKGTVAYLRTKD